MLRPLEMAHQFLAEVITKEDVVVDAAVRGCGVGRALVREALAIARSEGASRVMLTSNASRAAAHRLYESMGFERYDTDCYRFDL